MACLLVPAAEAAITTIATKIIEKKEGKAETTQFNTEDTAYAICSDTAEKIPFSCKLKWLNKLLWGGTALLAFEHVWHGEIVPYFPFLTAVSNPADTAAMLHELSTTGVTMAVFVTTVWGGMVAVSNLMETRLPKQNTSSLLKK